MTLAKISLHCILKRGTHLTFNAIRMLKKNVFLFTRGLTTGTLMQI